MKLLVVIVSLLCQMVTYSIVIIGHRGAGGYAPENTLSSFAKAIELGVDIIECDVRKCLSGELVVFHDAKVDRITDGQGYIASQSLHELKQLKVLETEIISTLEEVLDFINRRVKVYIELKDLHSEQDIVRIIDYYIHHKKWQYSDFIIASFDHLQLQTIKKINNKISTVALFYGIPLYLVRGAFEINADIVSLDTEFVTSELVAQIHQQNMKVYVYTVNDKETFFRLISYNVDGIITDFPDDIYDCLSEAF